VFVLAVDVKNNDFKIFYKKAVVRRPFVFNTKNFYSFFATHRNTIFLKSILTEQQLEIMIKRLAHQVLENHVALDNTVLIGLQPRGIFLSDQIVNEIKKQISDDKIQYGKLDITFYRDDIRKGLHTANRTDIPFSIEGKNIVLIDDVLYTGRTIRAALDALLDFGRPEKVELCVLIDRRFSRQLPIQPDYIGKSIDSILSQKIKVYWKVKDGKDEVILMNE
jgi:pyrimidine operon attenuation protein/uracil phosphoribosyltransferase